MLAIPLLILCLVIPALFWFHGKRFLGNQTHPAALFILAWMATALLLNEVEGITLSAGFLALIWVALSFAVCAAVERFRRKSRNGPEQIEKPGPRP